MSRTPRRCVASHDMGVILFEWVHLRPGKAAASRRLVEQGYRYLTIGRDALAVRPASIEAG